MAFRDCSTRETKCCWGPGHRDTGAVSHQQHDHRGIYWWEPSPSAWASNVRFRSTFMLSEKGYAVDVVRE